MYNDQVYSLVVEILKADITREAKTEIVKFMMLPRNTPVRPQIEIPSEEERNDLGTVTRPGVKDIDRRKNPEKYEGEDAVAETLKGKLDAKE